MSSFIFLPDVREPSAAPGGSTTFLVEVTTNLAEYEEHGDPLEPPPAAEPLGENVAAEADDTVDPLAGVEKPAPTLSLCPSRRIAVRRTFSEFVALREALCKSGGAAASLPPLPGKQLFGSASAETIEKRAASFRELLAACGRSEALATHEALVSFLAAPVAKPDYEAVQGEALKRMRAVLSLPATSWRSRYDKGGISICVSPVEGSSLYLIRSVVHVPLPCARVREHYTHTPNWRLWTPDASFSTVEMVRPGAAAVLQVLYRLPVVSNRDVVIYETQLAPGDEAAAGAHTAVAMSIEHPLCPKRRGVVRAKLLISVTRFEALPPGALQPADAGTPDGPPLSTEATRITSWQHADPRGGVPVSVVNSMIVRGKTQLKAMRKIMSEQLR